MSMQHPLRTLPILTFVISYTIATGVVAIERCVKKGKIEEVVQPREALSAFKSVAQPPFRSEGVLAILFPDCHR